MGKQKIIVVCGPTATGKSDYAVMLAKKINGEIVSTDSRQVYRGLDIGSGKVPRDKRRPATRYSYSYKGIAHHMIDVADPKRVFSVSMFQKKALRVIADILKRGKTPILCGGTGFYIDAVIHRTNFPAVKPNKMLRKKLSLFCAIANFQTLQQLDPERAATIDPKNNVRIIRAIEIATALGKVPTLYRSIQYNVQWHYLDFPDDILKQRIHDRLIKRVKQGMLLEVQRLHDRGVSWERLEALGLEYRYVALYLQKKLSKSEMLFALESAIWQYAKRQRTWFMAYRRKKQIAPAQQRQGGSAHAGGKGIGPLPKVLETFVLPLN